MDFFSSSYVSGNATAARDDFRGAAQDYSMAIELKPDYAEDYYALGLAKQCLKIFLSPYHPIIRT